MRSDPLDIVLIGPYGAGKSTLAELIAEKIEWSWHSLDSEYHRFLKQMEGFNVNLVNEMNTWEMVSPKREPYDAYVVERFMSEYCNPDDRCVLEFGAGHSVYEDRELFNHVKQIMTPYPNVVLVLPSPNLQESLQILLDQIRKHELKGMGLCDEEIIRINKYIIENHSNHELAKILVYTKSKSPEETSKEICSCVRLQA